MKHLNRGFTLLEVMATLAVLSISIVILIKSQTQSLTNVRNVQNYERAVYITENQLHWTFLDLNEAEDWTQYSNLTGEDGEYLWNVSIQPAEMETTGQLEAVMLRIVATTTWPQGRNQGQVQLETWYLWGQEQ